MKPDIWQIIVCLFSRILLAISRIYETKYTLHLPHFHAYQRKINRKENMWNGWFFLPTVLVKGGVIDWINHANLSCHSKLCKLRLALLSYDCDRCVAIFNKLLLKRGKFFCGHGTIKHIVRHNSVLFYTSAVENVCIRNYMHCVVHCVMQEEHFSLPDNSMPVFLWIKKLSTENSVTLYRNCTTSLCRCGPFYFEEEWKIKQENSAPHLWL